MLRAFLELLKKDNMLSQALELSHGMLRDDHEMFEAAIRSLRSIDGTSKEIDFDIYARDQVINAKQREVRRKVLTHLAVTGTGSLNAGLALVSVVIDIERIGDLTKNIVELALKYPDQLVCGNFEEDIRTTESTVRKMFSLLLESLPTYDRENAQEIMSNHWLIARRADGVIDALITKQDASLSCQQAVTAVLYIRYLKRISAHLMNIASSVVNPFDHIGFRLVADDASPESTSS